jgi:hypothetical protein
MWYLLQIIILLSQNIEAVDHVEASLDVNPADPHETTVPYVGVSI